VLTIFSMALYNPIMLVFSVYSMDGIEFATITFTTCNMFKLCTRSVSETALPVAVAAGRYLKLSLLMHGMAEAHFTPKYTLTFVT